MSRCGKLYTWLCDSHYMAVLVKNFYFIFLNSVQNLEKFLLFLRGMFGDKDIYEIWNLLIWTLGIEGDS